MPRYILFNKPFGVLSQFTGGPDQRTLAEFSLPAHVYAAGRLDKDSEGLLLLSDDGPFIKRLLDPANNHERKYWAELEAIDQNHAARKYLIRNRTSLSAILLFAFANQFRPAGLNWS